MNFLSIEIFLFVAINLVAFFVMLLDKNRSRKQGAERISEGMMFFMAAAMGSFGVYAGMFAFHHKSKKWYFIVGIPLLIIQNILTLHSIYLFLDR